MEQKPFVVEIDCGCFKPSKFALWFPYPVYLSPRGTRYHIHPKKRFKTKESAEKALELKLKH